MKIIGIDYGSVRTGLAVSDPTGVVAMPYKTVPTTDLFSYIASLTASENITRVVFGKSINLSGGENDICAQAKLFAKRLETELGIDTDFFDERFSSMAARAGTTKSIRRQSNRRNTAGSSRQKTSKLAIDAAAATLILQSYLDNKNQNADQNTD